MLPKYPYKHPPPPLLRGKPIKVSENPQIAPNSGSRRTAVAAPVTHTWLLWGPSQMASVRFCVVPHPKPLFTPAPLLTSVAVGRTCRALWGDATCYRSAIPELNGSRTLHLKK